MIVKLVPALLSLLLTIVPRAEAVTVRDIIELSRAGLSAEVLVALIEADPSVFDLQAGQILELKAAGVAENVIIAMLKAGLSKRVDEVPSPPAAPSPSPLEIQPLSGVVPMAPVVVVPVTVPVLVPVPIPVVPRHALVPVPAGVRGFGRFINDGFISEPVLAPSEPVYWGWGGKRRPDAWHERTQKPVD